MEDKTAIEIADAYIESSGFSTEGLKANVENPSKREFEVTFVEGMPDESQRKHRVFIGPYGDFLGLLLPDGTTAQRLPESEIARDFDEDTITSASRFLEAYGVTTSGLEACLVNPPRLITVWYELDTEDVVMGGSFSVFLAESGTVIHLQKDQ